MVAAESPTSGLEPHALWSHFEAFTRIARPSHHEEAMIQHVCAWASGGGLKVRQDEAGNVVIPVPASPGRESAPTVILQGHMDMVCERNPDSPNDPAEGRIELVRDGDWLTADGTTLGADDGVALAAMMTLAEDDSVQHGPLEILMTVAGSGAFWSACSTTCRSREPALRRGRFAHDVVAGEGLRGSAGRCTCTVVPAPRQLFTTTAPPAIRTLATTVRSPRWRSAS
jgi:hypothetical protein